MQALESALSKDVDGDEDARSDAIGRCSTRLTEEGFMVSWVVGTPNRGKARVPDLMASLGGRHVRVFVLTEDEVDARGTRAGLAAAAREGETRVYAPWPLRWRAFSNLDRWGLDGISVGGW